MKAIKILNIAAVFSLLGLGLQSCKLDHSDMAYDLVYPSALVTVKPDAEGTGFYMQLDDKTVLIPTNVTKSPYGNKEVRALVNYNAAEPNDISASNAYNGSLDKKNVFVNWMDSILTKRMLVPSDVSGSLGNDPVEIVNDWVTIVEDGYLTLRFRTLWGRGVTHYVNLIPVPDEKNPYHVKFCHDAKGDVFGEWADGLVAFRLDALPDTGDSVVDLVLDWDSFSGKKSVTFKYSTRKGIGTKSGSFIAEPIPTMKVE